jgi:hypothetical protein
MLSWSPVIYRTPFIQTAHVFASAQTIACFGRCGFKVPALKVSPLAKTVRAKAFASFSLSNVLAVTVDQDRLRTPVFTAPHESENVQLADVLSILIDVCYWGGRT